MNARRRLADRVVAVGVSVVCVVVLIAGLVILGPDDRGPERIDGLELDAPGPPTTVRVSDLAPPVERIPHRRLETTTTTEGVEP